MVSSFRYVPFVFVAILAVLSAGVIAPAAKVSYSASRYVLEVDGQPVGLAAVSGCRPVANVVTTQTPGATSTKHVGGMAFEPCAITLSGAPSAPLATWMGATLEGKRVTKDFALHRLDHNMKVLETTMGRQAIVSAIVFPTFDATSKDAAPLRLELTAEALSLAKGSGQTPGVVMGKQSKAHASNFLVTLDNVSLLGVVRVEGLSVRLPPAPAAAGTSRVPTSAPAPPEVGDVSLVVSTAKAQPLSQWAEDFLVNGNNAPSNEKTLKVTALASNSKDPLYDVTLTGVGVFGGDLYFPQGAAEASAMPRSTFLLYAEDATFQPHAAWS